MAASRARTLLIPWMAAVSRKNGAANGLEVSASAGRSGRLGSVRKPRRGELSAASLDHAWCVVFGYSASPSTTPKARMANRMLCPECAMTPNQELRKYRDGNAKQNIPTIIPLTIIHGW